MSENAAISQSPDWTAENPLQPAVCEEREFLEIAEDFSNPCEIFREAISNAFDADATEISIDLRVIRKGSREILRIEIVDNGRGMGRDELQAFFDLGNSTSRDVETAIGEKGHGTKIYYKSSHIEVITRKNGTELRASVNAPYDALANGVKPGIDVSSRQNGTHSGTQIIVDDYNHSIRDKFTHAYLKDYIYWFTKHGSVEQEFGRLDNAQVKLFLRGIGAPEKELLSFGHRFPSESRSLSSLLDEHKHKAPSYFVRKWTHSGTLKNFPDITWEAVFYLEGDDAKKEVNPMIRGTGRAARHGMYSVQERYGLWLCKDYIPVQRMNEWITLKGYEYTRFHAFVNCQAFRLTANRGSVMNTPPTILEDIQNAVTDYYKSHILTGTEITDLEWLEGQAASFVNQEKDEKDFEKRIKRLPKRKFSNYKGVHLVEPENEIGVFGTVVSITSVDATAFPFKLLDYTTYRGYDALATLSRDDLPLEKLSLAYIEFKYSLQSHFNHLFKHLAAIVCWDLDMKDGDEVTDVGDNRRVLKIVPGNSKSGEYTRYWLEDDRARSRIEVFVLSEYLRERLGVTFERKGPE